MSSQDPSDPTYSDLRKAEISWLTERRELYAEIARLKECIQVEQSKIGFVEMGLRYERARYLALKDEFETLQAAVYADQ